MFYSNLRYWCVSFRANRYFLYTGIYQEYLLVLLYGWAASLISFLLFLITDWQHQVTLIVITLAHWQDGKSLQWHLKRSGNTSAQWSIWSCVCVNLLIAKLQPIRLDLVRRGLFDGGLTPGLFSDLIVPLLFSILPPPLTNNVACWCTKGNWANLSFLVNRLFWSLKYLYYVCRSFMQMCSMAILLGSCLGDTPCRVMWQALVFKCDFTTFLTHIIFF